VEREAARIGYPIVIKPDRSVGGGQAHRRVQLAVTYAKNAGELRARAEGLLRFGKVVLQERFVGQGVGVELIANRGEIAYAFQHIRLHELPLSGGGSSLRRSAPLDPALLEASTRLVRVLKWHGVAMVEFKQNADTGEFRLMEINGRLWGSLPLAVACGADFPSMMYDLYIQGRIDASPPARVGISCRKLSDDIYWHELVLRRIDPTGLARFPPARVILRDALLCLSPRHRFDVQQLSDPRPGFVDVARIAKRYAVRLSEQWRERVLRSEQERRWRNGTAAAAMKTAGTVLFLCHGNINRSVLAQRYLEQRLGRKGIEVLSAGFHETEERSADPVMQDVAGRQGIDLSGWRSRTLSREMLSRADMVLVMESSHLKRIRREFPDLLGKCYMLGFAAPGRIPGGEIADPYGKDILEYERCFRQVTASVEAFAARLHGVHPG
jgi:protein-tyrosine-phosphatase